MSRFEKWAEREFSPRQRIIALAFEGILFTLAIPFFLVVASASLDRWLQLPRFAYGIANPLIGLCFTVIGLVFAIWSIQAQFTHGRGTPAPIMATQKLVVQRPYTYCRNPMAFGTFLAYLGIALWIGSLSAIGLVLLLLALLVTYIKLIEEKELAERFGSEYLEYTQNTPFLIPRLWKRD